LVDFPGKRLGCAVLQFPAKDIKARRIRLDFSLQIREKLRPKNLSLLQGAIPKRHDAERNKYWLARDGNGN
jgi:hypothetical protein